jgi:hypothetical protein
MPCGGRALVLGVRSSAGSLSAQYLLARLSPRHDHVDGITALGMGPFELTCGGGSLWLAPAKGSFFDRIDPATGKRVNRRQAAIGTGLAYAGGELWTVFPDGTVRQLGE